MNTAAKLLRRFEGGEYMSSSDLKPVLAIGQIYFLFSEIHYPELGPSNGQQLATTLLFLAAGVKPEEFL